MATLELISIGLPLLNMRWLVSGKGKMWLDDYQEILNTDNLTTGEPPPQYGRSEVTIYIEKECKLTGGKCAFELVPELKAENEKLKAENDKLKKKK